MKITKHLSERNFLILAILWTIGITIASLASLDNTPKITIPGKDKTAHFIFYFVFVIFWFLVLKNKSKIKNFSLILVFIAALYGIVMEIIQGLFTANRQADFYDVIANTLGAVFGIIIAELFLNKKQKQ